MILDKGAKTVQWGKDSLGVRMKVDPYFTPYTKVNSKWIKDLNVRAKTVKLLEDNIGQNLHEIRFGNDLLDVTPKAQATKVKIDKLDSTRVKNFCASKGTISRVKRQLMEWEKIFAKHASDKGLISRIYKALLHFSHMKTNNLIKKEQGTSIDTSPKKIYKPIST